MSGKKDYWRNARMRFVRGFWHWTYLITRVPFINEFSAKKELEAMKAIINSQFGEEKDND